MRETHVLVVGGERGVARPLTDFLRAQRADVLEVDNAKQAWDLLHRRPVDEVLTTAESLRGDPRFIAEVRRFDPQIEIVAIVADAGQGRQALADGAYDFFLEPVDTERLGQVVRHIGEAAELRERSDVLNELVKGTGRLGSLVTRDPRVIGVFKTAERLGRYQTPVLIEGEEGTGKESLARALHQIGREGRPFIVAEAATLTPQALEQAFAQARGGSLFIDDLMALRADAATALLGAIERGARGNGTSSVRVIAASREELGARAREGAFHEDLYQRLAGAVLTLPPLRERRTDIPVIARELVRDAVPGDAPAALSEGVAEALMEHDWSGNAGELRDVLATAARAAKGRAIELDDLPPTLRGQRGARTHAREGESRMLRDIEVQHLKMVLSETRGNKARAARVLGLSRWALQRKLQKHGIRLEELLAQERAS